MKKVLALVSLVFLLSISFVQYSEGADYPSRPLELIAPAGAGGGWDTLARTIDRALEVEKLYPQPISVINKVGGGGAVGLSYIFQKKGDDYELIVYSPPLIINTINKTFTQDYKELVPLAKLITDYQIFTVKADSPYKTFNDLLADLKKNPSAPKFAGASSPGSMDHLAMCKVAYAAGINPKDLVYVAFNNAGEATTALLGGNGPSAHGGNRAGLGRYLRHKA
jgi:putative tricarboxylic transport membrane protein